MVFLTDIDCVPCKKRTQFFVGCNLHDRLQQVKDLLRVTFQEENVAHIWNFQGMDFKNLTVNETTSSQDVVLFTLVIK